MSRRRHREGRIEHRDCASISDYKEEISINAKVGDCWNMTENRIFEDVEDGDC